MFSYGGVGFAMLEDRKFKSGDADGLRARAAQPLSVADNATLLGQRQEAFLAAWATTDAGRAEGVPDPDAVRLPADRLPTGTSPSATTTATATRPRGAACGR